MTNKCMIGCLKGRKQECSPSPSAEQELLLEAYRESNIVDSRFTPTLVIVAEMILDIYMKVVGQSAVVDKQILKLQELIEREIDYQQELVEVLGMLDTLFATMTTKKDASQQNRTANGLLEIGSGQDQVVGAT